MNYSAYEIIFLFMIYSFLGWCVEVIYHAVVKGHFINRGFDIGPICPIYGFGALSVILFLEPLKDYWGLLFAASVAFTTLIEFIAGFLLEKLFHEKWWDYSEEPYNIKGYICPRFSLMWGFACVIVVYVVHPTIIGFIRIIPHTIGIILLVVVYSAFAADLVVTFINVMHIRSSLRAISEIENSLEKLSYSIGTNLSDSTLDFLDKTEKLRDDLDEKQEEVKEAIEAAQWEFNDAKIKMQAQRQLDEQQRREEYAEMAEKRRKYTENVSKRSRRLRAAFPNIGSGRYKHVFTGNESGSSES